MFRVQELIAHARAGRIRVPSFQHGLKWEREDVQKLIDSIWRGYPIGTLLLWARPGPPGRVTLGDLAFEVNEQRSTWFVVDGQQRVVSLVSTLLPGRRAEKFDLYFDLETGTVAPPPPGGVPATHLPLNHAADPQDLQGWVDDHRASLTPEQVRLAFRVGGALREYELPAYVVHTDDEAVVREIFQRTNSYGKSLEASEVFDALHAPLDRKPALNLNEVAKRVQDRSLGEFDEVKALWDWLAFEREALQQQLEHEDLRAAVERIERALDRAFGFLAQDAGIPHLRLLPDQNALFVLGAFFARFPVPSPRSRRLLKRWLWRGAATGELRGGGDKRHVALEAVYAGRSDEEAARSVVATVSTRRPERKSNNPFDLRDARSRLSVIALIELRPHDLRTGALLNVAVLLESSDELVTRIVPLPQAPAAADRVTAFESVGNRLFHPAVDGSMLSLLADATRMTWLASAVSPHLLASHAISGDTVRALQEDDRVRFLELRRDEIEALTERLIDRHAEWNHSDRPSIAALIDEED